MTKRMRSRSCNSQREITRKILRGKYACIKNKYLKLITFQLSTKKFFKKKIKQGNNKYQSKNLKVQVRI